MTGKEQWVVAPMFPLIVSMMPMAKKATNDSGIASRAQSPRPTSFRKVQIVSISSLPACPER